MGDSRRHSKSERDHAADDLPRVIPRRAPPRPGRLHLAVVEAHTLVDRYAVPRTELETGAFSVDHARRLAVIEAHRRANIPGWRPWIRASLKHASAELLPEGHIPHLAVLHPEREGNV